MVTPQGTREFSSVDALVAEITGTPVPVRGLFEWLGGREASIDGWQADLSRHAEGRLQARRLSPVPVADLRLVFERS
jgi:outer membrane lipoprotein LolB